MSTVRVVTTLVLAVCAPAAAWAQSPRASALEAHAGYMAFVDEAPIEHAVSGAAYRHQVSPRVSIGPEVAYTFGPNESRRLFLTGNVWVDLVAPPPAGATRVTPYLVAGAGIMFHREFLHNEGVRWFAREGALTAGLGVRIPLGARWYVAPEARVGWEGHARFSAAVGYRPGR